MEILCSLRSYYDKSRLSRILASMFFFFILMFYLLPPILAVSGFDKLNSIMADFIFETIGLDTVITAPLIMVFIVMYAFIILRNKILGTIYSIILLLNSVYSIFGALMFAYSFSYKDFLILLPFLFLVILLLILNKFEDYRCREKYKSNNLFALLSILIPLFSLNFIGKLVIIFLNK